MIKHYMLANLKVRGFDESYHSGRGLYRPKCSQCETLVINGMACHETGCPNAVHECKGCNVLVPVRQTYCADCQ
jgi:hypothetical protein